MKNAMTLITLLASFMLVACAKDKPKEKNEVPAPSTTSSPAAPAAMTPPPAMRTALPAAPSAMKASSKTPTLKPAVVTIDPKGPMLTLIERECTRLGSYKNRVKHLNLMKEITCYNPDNGETRRVCLPSFPLTGRLTPSIVESLQVRKVDVSAYFHAEMKFGKVNVVTKDLVCHVVPVRTICAIEALRKQQASCQGNSCKKRVRKRRVRRSTRRTYRARKATRTRDSDSSGNGGPTAYDREQDRKIAANTTRSKDNTRRLDDNDKRWARRDKWAKAASGLLDSLKKK